MSALSFNPQQLLDQLIQEIQGDGGSLSTVQIDELIKGLPHINENQLTDLGEKESSCPICFTPYLALIAEEEMALAMESPAHPIHTIGVTKLSQPWQCGHMFCRRDISKWIIDGHDSCPLCRHTLVEGNQDRQDENSGVPLDLGDIQANLGAQLANVDGTFLPVNLSLGFHAPNLLLRIQRDENADRGVEYSGMYS